MVKKDILPEFSRRIPDEMIKSSQKFKIKNKKGKILNNDIIFNASGIISKGTNTKNGIICFFCKNTQKPDYNYVCLNYENNLFTTYLSIVYFDPETNQYRIKFNFDDIENLDLVYKEVQTRIIYSCPYYLSQKCYISMSKTIFKICLIVNSIIEIENTASRQKYIYNPLATKKITIGKDEKCNIVIRNDKELSLIHCTIEYDDKRKMWNVQDGSNIKESKTGTWISSADSYAISDGFEIKIVDSIIAFNYS